jgi:hypothetical protein
MERSNALLSWWERSSIFPAANTYNTTTISAKQPNQIIVAVAVNFYPAMFSTKLLLLLLMPL